MSAAVVATYLIETPLPLGQAAETLAAEQSTGSFTQIMGEEKAEPYQARVLSIQELGRRREASLFSAYLTRLGKGEGYQQARIRISFPLANVGANLPTWWATVAGNLFELGELTAVRLEHLELPQELVEQLPGPGFGVEGTRRLAGVSDGPLIGTIVKPSIGFSPEDYATRVQALAEAGLDFIKDDELMADPPHCPLVERVNAVMPVLKEHAQRTGKMVMYAFNITADCDQMRAYHDHVLRSGGTCVMVTLNTVGSAGVLTLRRHSQLPIHGHRTGWGMFTRHPGLGMAFQPYQALQRLAGADHLHVSGFQGKFWDSDETVGKAARACLTPLDQTPAGQPVMPAVSAGQWGGQAPIAYEWIGCSDLLYLAGGGIQGHPDGMAAGVAAIRAAWQATMDGVPLEEAAASCAPLASSLRVFGKKRSV